MALSPAERQARRRARLKENQQRERLVPPERRLALEDATAAFLRKPFYEFFHEWGGLLPSDFDLHFDLMGIVSPVFNDDRNPKSRSGEPEELAQDTSIEVYTGPKGSIGRAEVIVEQLIDAARTLSTMVNEYKRSELGARIEEVEADAALDPVMKALIIDRLNELLTRLQKETRESFPVIKIAGE